MPSLRHGAFLVFAFLLTSSCSRSETFPASEGKRLSGAPEKSLTLIVMSDLNGWAGSAEYDSEVHKIVRWAVAQAPDLVVLPGDLISIETSETESQIRAMWKGFESAVVKPLTDAKIPFAFSFGNHDTPNERGKALAREFWGPRKESLGLSFVDASEFPFRYSFTMGGAFFWSWDTNTQAVTSAQKAFAERALQSGEATRADFRVGIAHVPLYAMSSARNTSGETIYKYRDLESFLGENGVDLYMTGHHHAFYPARAGGIRYLHNGCLGGGPRQLLGTARAAFKSFSMVTLDKASGTPIRMVGYDAKTLAPVERAQLPTSVVGFDGRTAHLDPDYE